MSTDQAAKKNGAYLFALITGVIAAPLYSAVVGRKGQPGKTLIVVWSVPPFLVWVYNLGGMFKVWEIYEPWIGSLALLTITLVVGWLLTAPIKSPVQPLTAPRYHAPLMA